MNTEPIPEEGIWQRLIEYDLCSWVPGSSLREAPE